jgi:F-type H+-transporting ATPase subunit b
MHLDWFVFFCQIVNLLILVYLLKRFLYGRIIKAMDTREARIAAIFADAEKSREEARLAAEKHDQRLQELEDRYQGMLNKAREDADAHRRELMEKARAEVDMTQGRWLETLRSERETFLHELRRLAGSQIYSITRRVLKDLADLDLDERIVEILSEKIQAMDDEERRKFREAVSAEGKITVQCAFDIPPEARKKLDDVIRRCITNAIDVEYEKSTDMMSGYELRTDGHKIAWSMKDYLDTLEEKFYYALYEETQDRK